MAKNPSSFDELLAAIKSLPPTSVIRVREIMFRSATTVFATERDLVTGEGSKVCGGRWNPVGLAAIYASRTPETAMQEALAHYRYYGLPIQNSMPRVFVALELHLSTVLDLSSDAAVSQLGLSAVNLLDVDWRADMFALAKPLTQMVGRAVHFSGLEGLLVPSAADRSGINLVAFPDCFSAGSRVIVLNPGKLPA